MADLASQIRAQWGGYGNWDQGGIDHAAEFAQLLQANGITDLSKLSWGENTTFADGQRSSGESGDGEYLPGQGPGTGAAETLPQAIYDGKKLGFLGNYNADGSVTAGDPWQEGQASMRGGDELPLWGWSSQGHGNTSFIPFKKADGSFGVAPLWGSSSQDDLNNTRTAAAMALFAVGGAFAGAGGMTGAAANGAMTGVGSAFAGQALSGVPADQMGSGLLKGGITGAAVGGLGGYAKDAGWSNWQTGAVKGAAGAALNGGDFTDMAKGAAFGGAGGYANDGGITGNSTYDKAIVAGGKALVNGGGWQGAAAAAAPGLLGSLGADNAPSQGGGNMDFSSSFDPSLYDFGGDSGAPTFSYDQYFGNGSNFDNWSSNYNPTDWGGASITFGTDSSGNLTMAPVTGSANTAGVSLGDFSKLLGGASGLGTLGKAALALYGASQSKNGTSTNTRDPWAPAQPFLLNQLGTGAALQDRLQKQPFSHQQQTAYGNVGNLLDVINAQAPQLLQGFNANATGANQFVRGGGRGQTMQPAAGFNAYAYTPAGLLGALGSR